MPTTNAQTIPMTTTDRPDLAKLYLVSGSAVIEFDTDTNRHRTLDGDEAEQVRRWVERDRYLRRA